MPLIGVISDTHGLLRPQVQTLFADADRIIHAGDVGSPDILQELAAIAPVTAVLGNVDTAEWARTLTETQIVSVGRVELYVLHNLKQLKLDPSARFAAVIYGHSHKPETYRRGGVLFLNPGSAGPRRFKLPVSVALLHVGEKTIDAELIELEV